VQLGDEPQQTSPAHPSNWWGISVADASVRSLPSVRRGGGDVVLLKVEEVFLATRAGMHGARSVRRQALSRLPPHLIQHGEKWLG